jgi:hypothetical protein
MIKKLRNVTVAMEKVKKAARKLQSVEEILER